MKNDLDKIARGEAEKVYPKSDGNPYYSTARDIFVGAFRNGYNYPKWVSVEDALPDTDRIVLILVEDNMPVCGAYLRGANEWLLDNEPLSATDQAKITKWMDVVLPTK